MSMNFGLAYSEIAVIMLVALIVLGPKKLPELMRQIGKVMGTLRKASDDLRREILYNDEMRSFRDTIRDVIEPPRSAPPPPFASPPPVPPKLKVKPKDETPAPAPEPPQP